MLNKPDFVIGFLGGLQIRKGWSFVYELIMHGRKNESWKFMIGGIGQSKYPALPDNALKVGTIDNHVDLIGFYSSLDVLLVPSIQEAFGLVAQEAQSCGVPVIVFDDTGCADIVSDSLTGFVVKKGSLIELVNVLRHLQNFTEIKKNEMKTNSRLRAQSLWNYEIIAKKYEEKYKEIVLDSQM